MTWLVLVITIGVFFVFFGAVGLRLWLKGESRGGCCGRSKTGEPHECCGRHAADHKDECERDQGQ